MENNRYSNSKVYKLIDNTENQYYYIGSTTTSLAKRLWKHKQHGKEHPHQKVYKYFNSIDWNARIILISEHCLENKDQLRREEDNVIKEVLNDKKCLNSKREFTTKEEKQESYKQYYVKIKQQYHQVNKNYREKNKDKIEERMKPYREAHKKEKQEYDKMYREKNKEKLREKESVIHNCKCGGTYTDKHKSVHEKSKKHLKFLENDTSESI